MRFTPLILLLFWIPSACSHLPRLLPMEPSLPTQVQSRCHSPYVRGEWQLVHAIAADLPNGDRQTMLGISQISSDHRTVHCVLLTLEGMVMFEARFEGGIKVLRALPPFDTPGFAQGLVDDIMLMLLAPAGDEYSAGRGAGGELVCRWGNTEGFVQDNVFFGEHDWEIRRYSASGQLIRKVTRLAERFAIAEDNSISSGPFPLPKVMQLKAFGMIGYELTLTLLEAQPLAPATQKIKVLP